ncbi:universal stress protein [Rhodococcus sp. ABRD24]|uniref:universal stress protein n=1 Tax=Rhodococcus sp. ABRD24 TaxID=2507582 RepID=UPI0013F17DDC|nr:universal stress protein [Rhodococcus sp. ABRD24]
MARGRLRIYLGAAPGVGKTYEMLREGHRRADQGANCVIGVVEPHGRRATAAMAEGLPTVPRRCVSYRGLEQSEMDLDAVLARRPQVVLVDELAHSNAPGSRHLKRWEDVEELLEAGIDVVTTLNVQHLESLGDVVAQVTGVRQRESVPDWVARKADELELVDLSPESLRRRMVAGDIYPPNRIDAALSHYFRPGNLTALRELALLWLADRVDEGLQRYRAEHGITAAWETRERIVAGVSGGPDSEALIRRAARMAARTPGSELMAVYVVRSDGRRGADQLAVNRCRTLVESLGGSWHQVVGTRVGDALGRFARYENATQLVVGASGRGGVRAWVSGREDVVREVSRAGNGLDVHIVSEEKGGRRIPLPRPQWPRFGPRGRTLAIVLLFLLVPAVAVALTGAQSELVLYLSVGVPTALLAGWLAESTARGRRSATRACAEAAAVTSMASAVLRGRGELPRMLELVRETFGLEAVSLLERPSGAPSGADSWFISGSCGDRPPERPGEATVRAELSPASILAGRGPDLLPADREIFTACAIQIAEMDRVRHLAERAAGAEQYADREHQRAALAATAGRVFAGPVASAKLALHTLGTQLRSRPEEQTLLEAAEHEVDRIGDLVQALTDLAGMREFASNVHLRQVDVAEVVMSALDDLGPGPHALDVRVPDDLPEVIADAALLSRVIAALAADALRRSRPGTVPGIAARASGAGRVEIRFRRMRPVSEPARIPDDSGEGAFVISMARDLVEAVSGTLVVEEPSGEQPTVVVSLRGAGGV